MNETYSISLQREISYRYCCLAARGLRDSRWSRGCLAWVQSHFWCLVVKMFALSLMSWPLLYIFLAFSNHAFTDGGLSRDTYHKILLRRSPCPNVRWTARDTASPRTICALCLMVRLGGIRREFRARESGKSEHWGADSSAGGTLYRSSDE